MPSNLHSYCFQQVCASDSGAIKRTRGNLLLLKSTVVCKKLNESWNSSMWLDPELITLLSHASIALIIQQPLQYCAIVCVWSSQLCDGFTFQWHQNTVTVIAKKWVIGITSNIFTTGVCQSSKVCYLCYKKIKGKKKFCDLDYGCRAWFKMVRIKQQFCFLLYYSANHCIEPFIDRNS